MFPLFYVYSDWVILALRVFLGAVFVSHGLPKIKNLNQVGQNFEAMGFKPGSFWGPFIAVLEVFGGVALILGFLTQIFTALFAVEMAVGTLWKMSRGQKLVEGYELDLALLLISLILLTSGIGPYSLDEYLLQVIPY